MQSTDETSVLVVGGGLVGLTMALLLQQQGTRTILIEREKEPSPLPRARGWAVRSMEIWRSLALQSAVEQAAQAAWEQGVFGGARRGESMLGSVELPIPDTKVMTGADASPCSMVACPQTQVELLLRTALEERGGDVRFGCELVRFTSGEEHVCATVRTADGEMRDIRANYLVAADGNRSRVREELGIDRHGSSRARHYLNVFFEADLTEQIKGRTFSQCEVKNEKVEGLFLSMNNTTRWSFHLRYDPDQENPETWTSEHLRDLLHAAIGEAVPLQVLHCGTWVAVDRVADRYSQDRAFLIGDAAHIMPPWGGLNGNTGIADAHNLAWKLAAVERGEYSPALLETYGAERQPVADRNTRQAQLRSDYEIRFGIRTKENAERFDDLRDGGELLMRYRYGQNDTVDRLRCDPGTRFPHAWIQKEGKRMSTLDLFGKEITVLGGPGASPNALRAGVDFTFEDKGVDWASFTGKGTCELIQVRPDGFIVSDASSHGSLPSAGPSVTTFLVPSLDWGQFKSR